MVRVKIGTVPRTSLQILNYIVCMKFLRGLDSEEKGFSKVPKLVPSKPEGFIQVLSDATN